MKVLKFVLYTLGGIAIILLGSILSIALYVLVNEVMIKYASYIGYAILILFFIYCAYLIGINVFKKKE